MTTRKEILDQASTIVAGEREDSYGGPEDSFRVIASFWDVYLNARKSGPLKPYDVACMMLLLKTARLIAADGNHYDSWVDIAGYAACGGECGVVSDARRNPAPGVTPRQV